MSVGYTTHKIISKQHLQLKLKNNHNNSFKQNTHVSFMASIKPLIFGRYTYHNNSNIKSYPVLLLDESESGVIKRVDFLPSNDILLPNQDLERCSFRFELPYLVFKKSKDARKLDETELSPRRLEDFDDFWLDALTEKLSLRYRKPGKKSNPLDVREDLIEIRNHVITLRRKLGDSYRGNIFRT